VKENKELAKGIVSFR